MWRHTYGRLVEGQVTPQPAPAIERISLVNDRRVLVVMTDGRAHLFETPRGGEWALAGLKALAKAQGPGQVAGRKMKTISYVMNRKVG